MGQLAINTFLIHDLIFINGHNIMMRIFSGLLFSRWWETFLPGFRCGFGKCFWRNRNFEVLQLIRLILFKLVGVWAIFIWVKSQFGMSILAFARSIDHNGSFWPNHGLISILFKITVQVGTIGGCSWWAPLFWSAPRHLFHWRAKEIEKINYNRLT